MKVAPLLSDVRTPNARNCIRNDMEVLPLNLFAAMHMRLLSLVSHHLQYTAPSGATQEIIRKMHVTGARNVQVEEQGLRQ